MERSRVQAQFRHQPDQVFEHEVDGILCVVSGVYGHPPRQLDLPQILEALDLRLDRWAGPLAGFPRPAVQHEDGYELVVPRHVTFDVWPRVLCCERDDCGAVVKVQRDHDLPGRTCKVCCLGRLRQLPYYLVHDCGVRNPLPVARCDTHGDQAISFRDGGSFRTAEYRCRLCNQPLRIPVYRCRNCQIGQGTARMQHGVTSRDSRAYFPQHLSLITLSSSQVAASLRATYGPHYALGHYTGQVVDLSGLDHPDGPQEQGDPEAFEHILKAIEGYRETNPDRYESMRRELMRNRGDQPVLEDVTEALGDEVLDAARGRRRIMERAWMFRRDLVDDADDIVSRARTAGHYGLAQRLEAGIDYAHRRGLSRLAVVRRFPIALVGFGYTRWSTVGDSYLSSYEPMASGKRPLVAVEADTEAIFVELDAHCLWEWCSRNGWTTTAEPTNETQARVWLLHQTLGDANGDAAVSIRRATHVWSHLLIHALAGRSSFDPNSVAEYLLEDTAGVLIYAANYSSFTLGALTALVEQHTETWLEAGVEGGRTCVHDPVCRMERGGCHKCLAVAFGCERFNKGLERGYLYGGGTLGIADGLIRTAARRATRAAA